MAARKAQQCGSASDAEQTKARLVEACAHIIAERGWAAATSRTIAEAANANPALINYHFGGKRALLLAALDWSMARLEAGFEHRFTNRPSGPQLKDFLNVAVASIPDARALPEVRILSEAMTESLRDEDVAQAIRSHLGAFRGQLRQLIEAELGDRSDVAGLATLCSALLDGLMLHQMLDPNIDTKAAMEAFVAMLYG